MMRLPLPFFALDRHDARFPLMILDCDIVQIEGTLLETWLPIVSMRLEELARQCQAIRGSIGALIEDKDSGTILLQQALSCYNKPSVVACRRPPLTAMGKDERAINVSGNVKYTDYAFNKVSPYKRRTKNHLVDQIENFRMGDRRQAGR